MPIKSARTNEPRKGQSEIDVSQGSRKIENQNMEPSGQDDIAKADALKAEGYDSMLLKYKRDVNMIHDV